MLIYLIILPIPFLLLFLFLRRLRIKNLGSISITTSSVAYDEASFGHLFSWDKYCFYINSKPVWIHSGEFHYWRLPDQSRWKSILLQYKSCGLNSIRIYFSWAYHSPGQGIYHFDGNRDIEYLLSLCEELELFVLAAPGPYICAETQGGGHPAWLVAKREIRLRHSVTTMYRNFDAEYSKYCIEWFGAILPIIARHQITAKLRGCVLALQIENEAFETIKGIPIGLSDDMKTLAKSARDFGISVPLFTNDAWEEGSFVPKSDNNAIGGIPTFGIDLYGFDKYVVFCPTSNPFSIPSESSKNKSTWNEWNPKDVVKAFSSTEATVRGFGGGAASSPIFIPELQGGWFNHYTVGCTFDDVYSFYGDEFTKMVTDTAISQGCTAFNIYMFYGGTNWGTLGDPDVYTSYDYSACIREYGHISSRARKLRLGMSFAKSFSPELLKTECNDNHVRSSFVIQSSITNFISKQRKSSGPSPMYFVFFRNFNDSKVTSSTITVARYHREPIQLTCKLGYKESFIGIGNYKTRNGLHLILSTLPIYVRTQTASKNEIWIIQSDKEKNGQLAFQGDVDVNGTLDAVTQRQDDITIISFKANSGWCKIQSKLGGDESALYIISLTGNDLYTLTPIFRDSYWKKDQSLTESHVPEAVFWGAYQINYDVGSGRLDLALSESEHKIRAIASPLAGFSEDSSLNVLQERGISIDGLTPPNLPKLSFQEVKRLDLPGLPWVSLDLVAKSTYPSKNCIDFCYLSGHAVYKLGFLVPAGSFRGEGLILDVTARHRCYILLNNKSIGGHLTYSLSSLKPGAKQGPDFGRHVGWKKYLLPASEIQFEKLNEVYIIVESLGLNRSPGPIDDIRSPRGLLDARIRGIKSPIKWSIAGVDVRKLDQAFNHSGFPEQIESTGSAVLDSIPKGIILPTWFKATFNFEFPKDSILPLRLCVSGNNSAYIYLNDIIIGRYYKEGPQRDFFVPTGLLVSGEANTLKLMTFNHSDPDSTIKVSLNYWSISSSDNFLITNSSGNIENEQGHLFALQTLSLESLKTTEFSS